MNGIWNVGDAVYERVIEHTNVLFSAHPTWQLKGILWHQGEADAQGGTAPANAYEDNLDDLVANMRSRISAAGSSTPFISGGLMEGLAGASTSDRSAVNDALEALPTRIAYTAYAASTGLSSAGNSVTGDDDVHFNAASLRLLGSRYFDALDVAEANTSATTPASVPDEPTSLSVTPGDGQNVLFWAAPADDGGATVTGYRIQQSADGGANWTNLVLDTSPDASTTYTATGLVNGTDYAYRLKSKNVMGFSANFCVVATGTPSSSVTTPSAPTNLAAAAGDAEVDLSWSPPTDNGGASITGYKIDVSVNGGGAWTNVIGNTGTAATTYTHTGLTNGTPYTYRVTAFNSQGAGPQSGLASATPEAPDVSAGELVPDSAIENAGAWTTLNVTITGGAAVAGGINGYADIDFVTAPANGTAYTVAWTVVDYLGGGSTVYLMTPTGIVTTTANKYQAGAFSVNVTAGQGITKLRVAMIGGAPNLRVTDVSVTPT